MLCRLLAKEQLVDATMAQMDIDAKLEKSLDELIRTSKKGATRKKSLTKQKRKSGDRGSAKVSALGQPASAQPPQHR